MPKTKKTKETVLSEQRPKNDKQIDLINFASLITSRVAFDGPYQMENFAVFDYKIRQMIYNQSLSGVSKIFALLKKENKVLFNDPIFSSQFALYVFLRFEIIEPDVFDFKNASQLWEIINKIQALTELQKLLSSDVPDFVHLKLQHQLYVCANQILKIETLFKTSDPVEYILRIKFAEICEKTLEQAGPIVDKFYRALLDNKFLAYPSSYLNIIKNQWYQNSINGYLAKYNLACLAANHGNFSVALSNCKDGVDILKRLDKIEERFPMDSREEFDLEKASENLNKVAIYIEGTELKALKELIKTLKQKLKSDFPIEFMNFEMADGLDKKLIKVLEDLCENIKIEQENLNTWSAFLQLISNAHDIYYKLENTLKTQQLSVYTKDFFKILELLQASTHSLIALSIKAQQSFSEYKDDVQNITQSFIALYKRYKKMTSFSEIATKAIRQNIPKDKYDQLGFSEQFYNDLVYQYQGLSEKPELSFIKIFDSKSGNKNKLQRYLKRYRSQLKEFDFLKMLIQNTIIYLYQHLEYEGVQDKQKIFAINNKRIAILRFVLDDIVGEDKNREHLIAEPLFKLIYLLQSNLKLGLQLLKAQELVDDKEVKNLREELKNLSILMVDCVEQYKPFIEYDKLKKNLANQESDTSQETIILKNRPGLELNNFWEACQALIFAYILQVELNLEKGDFPEARKNLKMAEEEIQFSIVFSEVICACNQIDLDIYNWGMELIQGCFSRVKEAVHQQELQSLKKSEGQQQSSFAPSVKLGMNNGLILDPNLHKQQVVELNQKIADLTQQLEQLKILNQQNQQQLVKEQLASQENATKIAQLELKNSQIDEQSKSREVTIKLKQKEVKFFKKLVVNAQEEKGQLLKKNGDFKKALSNLKKSQKSLQTELSDKAEELEKSKTQCEQNNDKIRTLEQTVLIQSQELAALKAANNPLTPITPNRDRLRSPSVRLSANAPEFIPGNKQLKC